MSDKVQKKIRRERNKLATQIARELADAKRRQRARVVAVCLLAVIVVFFRFVADLNK